MATVVRNGEYVDTTTGEILDPKIWIITEWGGRINKVKRISDKQLNFINSLEYQLGHAPKNHQNMPAFKAVKTIKRLQGLLAKKSCVIEGQEKLL